MRRDGVQSGRALISGRQVPLKTTSRCSGQ